MVCGAPHFVNILKLNIAGNLHCRDVHEDNSDGVHSPREFLPEEHVEHHGLRGGGVWVSKQRN